jgi:pyruvate,orthophosphate dikinase
MAKPIAERRPESSALRANLEETRRDVVVPEAYEALRDAVAQYYGVRQVVDKLLTEYFHPLRNALEVIRQLKPLTGTMFHYFERTSVRDRCAERLHELCAGLEEELDDPLLRRRLIASHLQLLETLSGSEYATEYQQTLVAVLEHLRSVQGRDPLPFLPLAGQAKRLGTRLWPSAGLCEAYADFYRGTVEFGLDVFEEVVALDDWSRSGRAVDPVSCRGSVVAPIGDAIAEIRSKLAAATSAAEILGLPNADDLLGMTLDRVRRLASPIDRIALYVHLAGVRELEHRNLEILRALTFSIKTVCDEGTDDDVKRAVDLVTDQLVACDTDHKRLLYQCLEKLGRGVAGRRGEAVTRHVVERTVATGFESPRIRGVSDEWEVWVNPHHLPCVRTWLAIIESDPIAYEQLLSALVINLHFQGLFVADTDLFQRDVSNLLNADIGDAFSLIMQVVTYFPVFFNEVGSEGELRDVSTRIDQITHRRDPVVHFLRKQSHAESNNRLVPFAAAVYNWWRCGDAEPLRDHLPDTVFARLDARAEWCRGVHTAVSELERRFGIGQDDLGSRPIEDYDGRLREIEGISGADRERVLLLVRLYRLLRSKYSLSSEGLDRLLDHSALVSSDASTGLTSALERQNHLEVVRSGNRVLAELKATIVSPEVTEAFENIFHKRHIAAGIPSMYGTYSEPKFDSMGLMLRVMDAVRPHLEACVSGFNYRYMTRASIRTAHDIMAEMLAGLRISGLRVQHLSTKLDILRRGIALGNLSASQYLNIFDFMSEALNDVVQTNYIALHDANLDRLGPRLAALTNGSGDDVATADSLSERFIRALIAQTYAIQEFDLFLRRIRESLRGVTEALSPASSDRVLNYAPDRLVSFLHDPPGDNDDQLSLGYKGYSLKHLHHLGLPVPDGFVISTELFNLRTALDYPDLRTDVRERLVAAVHELEHRVDRRLGDAERPLLMAVRSGSAFSMPGAMDTILNVGLDDEVLESLSNRPEEAWGAWDCYRRYVQNVAMSCGVSRDRFDATMLRCKERYRVRRKAEFTADQMRELAIEYRRVVEEAGITIHTDPVEQLMQAVLLVLASWDGKPAQIYRQQLDLADGWGTAVIVQAMVFGNMHADAGSGVAFTRDPRSSSTGIGLFGDFTIRSQGEDVVAGLVHPHPVSEKQRLVYAPEVETSLETRFPAIYQALHDIAHRLLNEHGYEHQEIEFTFESADPEDLHLLQIRPMRLLRQGDVDVFEDPGAMADSLLTSGIGVSGGAMTGAVAFTSVDIKRAREQDPARHVILLRPDTVPEDIHLVTASDGLLTARGGFTSHAAVTAKRLGKCCIVNCAELVVSESENAAHIGSRAVLAGDMISIDGLSGRVYLGDHQVVKAGGPIHAW